MPAALTAADWQQVRRLLHSLRGACGAIGATDLLARSGALAQALDALLNDRDGKAAEPAGAGALAAQARQIDQDVMALASVIQGRLDRRPGSLSPP